MDPEKATPITIEGNTPEPAPVEPAPDEPKRFKVNVTITNPEFANRNTENHDREWNSDGVLIFALNEESRDGSKGIAIDSFVGGAISPVAIAKALLKYEWGYSVIEAAGNMLFAQYMGCSCNVAAPDQPHPTDETPPDLVSDEA